MYGSLMAEICMAGGQRVNNSSQGCMQIFFQGGGKFGVRTKEGGGSLCKVLHPTLARRGAKMTQGGANAPPPPPPPLKYSPGSSK